MLLPQPTIFQSCREFLGVSTNTVHFRKHDRKSHYLALFITVAVIAFGLLNQMKILMTTTLLFRLIKTHII